MRGRGLSAPERHSAPGHQVRERAAGEHGTRKVDRFRVRQNVRGPSRATVVEPDVLRQFVVRGSRGAPGTYKVSCKRAVGEISFQSLEWKK